MGCGDILEEAVLLYSNVIRLRVRCMCQIEAMVGLIGNAV